MQVKHIKYDSEEDMNLLATFKKNAGKALLTFRYFDKRSFEVLNNHLYTILLLNENEQPVGYGHLDKDGNTVWLGICIEENSIGKGLGKKIIESLINYAKLNKIQEVVLKVDATNIAAITLYKRFNFIEVEADARYKTMIWKWMS